MSTWGISSTTTYREVRAEVRREGLGAVEIHLRSHKGPMSGREAWRFECTGPHGLYAKSAYTFRNEKDAAAAAEVVADALLFLTETEKGIDP